MGTERFKGALLSTLVIASLMSPLLLISAEAAWAQDIEWIRQFESSAVDYAPGNPGGGWLVIAQPEDPDILDPARTVYPWAVNVNNLIYESLLTYDRDMNIIPMLAEDLPTYNDVGMFYEFKLKRGIKFHDGSPFTAEAVVYTLDRLKHLPGSKHIESVKNVPAAEIKDDYTVRIYLTDQDRYLKEWFATSSSVIVSPQKAEEYGSEFGTVGGPPSGTGPFKFKEWKAGDKITLERFDDYNWGPEMYQNKGPAYLDGIVFRVVPEDLPRETMFEAGEVDFVTNVRENRELLERWEDDPDIVLHIGPQVGNLVYLGFNTASTGDHGYGYENGELPPGSVPRAVPKKVRQAIAYALDENRFIELAYAGVGTPPISWLADTIWGSINYQENMYPYNPEKARQLLTEAGYADDLELEMIHWTDPHYDVIGTEMQRQLENVGIKLTQLSLEFTIVEDKIRNKDYDMIVGGYNWPLADMIWWEWHTVRLPSPNRFWWGDDYTDAIIDNTWSMDDEVALKGLQESQRLIAEDAAGLGLLHRGFVTAWRSYVKGYMAHPIPSNWHFLDTYLRRPYAVSMSVSPMEDNGSPGSLLEYTVIVTNIGTEADTYMLEVSDNAGWNPSVLPDRLTIESGGSYNVTLRVVVPPDAGEGTSITVNVSARSEGNPTVTGSDTCRTIVTGAPVVDEVEYQVGVKADDWIKYDYTISGAPPGTPLPTWMKVEFPSVEETSATALVTMHMSDGTESSETMTVDVTAGGGTFGGLSGFVIPANLTVGDSIDITGYGTVTIGGESTKTYAGASRTVVYASFSQYGTQLTYYWDKETGVMVEASTTSDGLAATAKVTETSIWQAGPPAPTRLPLIAGIIGIIAIIGIVAALYMRRRKPTEFRW